MTSMTPRMLVLLLFASLWDEIVPRLSEPSILHTGLPIVGQDFSLDCVCTSPEGLDNTRFLPRQWLRESTEIPGETGVVLRFSKLRKDDRGNYTCRINGESPETVSDYSKSYNMDVLVPPQVHIEPTSPDGVVKGIAGGKLTLTCVVTEAHPKVPEDGYSWSYPPSTSGTLRALVEQGNTLNLVSLTKEDMGQYVCQANNSQSFGGRIPSGNASVTVDVSYLGSVSLTPQLVVNEGDYVALPCSVDSNPVAHLAWTVGGQKVRHVTANKDHYVLQRAACSDSKIYTCRASNKDLPGLERHASTPLTVKCSQGAVHAGVGKPSHTNIQKNESPLDGLFHLEFIRLKLVIAFLSLMLIFVAVGIVCRLFKCFDQMKGTLYKWKKKRKMMKENMRNTVLLEMKEYCADGEEE